MGPKPVDAGFSKRCFQRVAYTPLRTLDMDGGEGGDPDEVGDALAKINLLQGLEVTPGEAGRVAETADSDEGPVVEPVLAVLLTLSNEPALAAAPGAAALRDSALLTFSTLLQTIRGADLWKLQEGIATVRARYAEAIARAADEATEGTSPTDFSIASLLSSLDRSVTTSEHVRALAFASAASATRLRDIVISGTKQQAAAVAREGTPSEALGWAVVNAPDLVAPLSDIAALHLFPLQHSGTPAVVDRILLAESEMQRRIATVPTVLQAYARRPIEPVGLLHLERLEMTPKEIVRGELVYSLPLAPLERATITHREWTTYQEEFSRYIQDFLEEYSERGVAQSEDVAMATSSQSRHANALSMGQSPASTDLELGMTGAVALGPSSSVEDGTSRTESRTELRQLTSRASTRTIRDHKVSFTMTRATGTDTTSARVIRNPNRDKSMQIDYYRRMRRWTSELYRWGVRMTWDLVLPDPGRDLRRRVQELAEVEAKLAKPFAFDITVSQVSEATWETLAAEYGATLAPPPAPRRVEMSRGLAYNEPNVVTPRADGNIEIVPGQPAWLRSWRTEEFAFDIQQGYEARTIHITVNARFFRFPGDDPYIQFAGEGSAQRVAPTGVAANVRATFDVSAPSEPGTTGLTHAFAGQIAGVTAAGIMGTLLTETRGYVERYVAQFLLKQVATAAITLSSDLQPASALVDAWRIKCWAQLREAAGSRDARLREQWRDRRAVLLRELASTDALTLRRREREQTMRLVLSWLFPDFAASNDVLDVIAAQVVSGNALPTAADALTRLKILEYGAHIRFIHDAVDWDRLHFILYPYFWDADVAQAGKLFLEHPDAAHREFLRAGAVRVLLPVRPGFEESFSSLVYLGTIGSLPEAHRFLRVAEQVEAANAKFGELDPDADPVDVVIPGVLIGRWDDSTPTAALQIDVQEIPVA